MRHLVACALSLAFISVLSAAPADERPSGDVNGDGTVNCADLALVRASLGRRVDDPEGDARADIDRDGIVDARDLALVARQLKTGTKCPSEAVDTENNR